MVQPPQVLNGTMVDATLEPTNDSSSCAETDSSVWYRFTAPERGAVVVQLDAAGEMDATVDLYKQVRSKLEFADGSATDSKGNGTLDTEGLEAGADYAIRVGNQTGSVANAFGLRVMIPTPPPAPPGQRLPAAGVSDRVDRLLNSGDAYWSRMHAGRTMRLSLQTDDCTSLDVYGPGTESFSGEPVRRLRCGGFGLFTPTRTGRHFLVVRAGRSRDVQLYTLRVARALRDDTTPGVVIRNHSTVKGSVDGGIDSRDLYQFGVRRRSALNLVLAGGPAMRLVSDDGRRMGSGNVIARTVPAGRYFVAVEGSGRYTLRLAVRTITRASLLFNGKRRATIAPGSSARLSLRVRPAAAGPSQITLERLDPIKGWQFLRTYRPRVSKGLAKVPFRPPSVGRYRAVGRFLGSRNAAPDDTETARLRVQRPPTS